MAAQATVEFAAQHPVLIDWGDGSALLYATESPAHHLYGGGAGPWTVTLTDTVHGKASTGLVSCPTCDLAGAQLHTSNPASGTWSIGPLVNGSGAALYVHWGDGATDTVLSGASGTHTYTSNGPYAVLVEDSGTVNCFAAPSGGNGSSPDEIVVPPGAAAFTCNRTGPGADDTICLTLTHAPAPSYLVTWDSGGTAQNVPVASPPADVTVCHTYTGVPRGTTHVLTVADPETGWSYSRTLACFADPTVTSLTCSASTHLATLVVTSYGRVEVDWGDASAHTISEDGNLTGHQVTLTHQYATGPLANYTVITAASLPSAFATSTPITCDICRLAGTALSPLGGAELGRWSIGPITGAVGPVRIAWGDTTTSLVDPGQSGSHIYDPAAGSGPFTVTATDTVSGCTATVTGGNGTFPAQVYVPPVVTTAVTAGRNEVCLTLSSARGEHYVVNWGDGNLNDLLRGAASRPWTTTACHTYAGGGGAYSITVTETSTPYTTTITGTVTATWSSMAQGYTSWNTLLAANSTWTAAIDG